MNKNLASSLLNFYISLKSSTSIYAWYRFLRKILRNIFKSELILNEMLKFVFSLSPLIETFII